METHNTNSSNALDHTPVIKNQFDEIISHLRQDIAKVDDPQAKALFEGFGRSDHRVEKSIFRL